MILKLLVTTAVILCCALQLNAQTNDVSARLDDARQITTEQKRAALTTLSASAKQAEAAGEFVKASRFLNRVGGLQIRINSPQEALATYKKALAFLRRSPDPATRIDALTGMASVYRGFGKCEKAQTLLQNAIDLSEQTNYTEGRARALLDLSACQNLSDHPLALKTAQQSLQLWQSLDDKWGIARANTVVGHYQLAQNDLSDSTQSHLRALGLWRDLALYDQEAEALIYLGFIEYRKGGWQESISFLTQAQALLDAEDNAFEMGQISGGIGEAFLESGLPDLALTKLLEAQAHFERAHAPQSVYIMSWDIGRAYYLMSKYSEALTNLQQSLAGSESIKDRANEAMCHDYLGRTYAAINDDANALSHFEIALEMYRKVGDVMEAGRTKVLIGQIYERQSRVDLARHHYQEALAILRSVADGFNESAALFALGQLELKQKNLTAAEDYLAESIRLTENIRRVSTTNDLAAAFSATVQQRYQSYIEVLMQRHQAHPEQGFAVRAFETSELARARSLSELLRETQTNLAPGVGPELAAREKSLRQSLRVKEDAKVRLLGGDYKKEELLALENELSKLESEYKQVLDAIRQQFPAYEQIRQPTAWTLKQIQEHILPDDNTLLLEYSLGNERSYLWAVSRTAFSSYELASGAEIEKVALQLYELLKANQPVQGETFEQRQTRVRQAEGQLQPTISSLSKLLLGPVSDKLGTKRLLIVPDGAVQYIPFQVLVVPAQTSTSDSAIASIPDERPLIVDHEIVNEPSASILALVVSESAKRKQTAGSVAIIADPVFDRGDPRIESSVTRASESDLNSSKSLDVTVALRDIDPALPEQIARLPASREEAEAIMAVVPTRSGFKALDFDANRDTATSTNLSQYRIVHFATHAFLNNHHPAYSGIVLSLVNKHGASQDGFLRMSDIYNLKLPVNLVVLSACQTGLGKDVKGEGLIGLTRGFMYAGASGVVASLWKVDDNATAELMKHFYEGMFKQGLTPAAALRHAQLAVSRQKRWRAPYYWAGFVLQGQYTTVISSSQEPLQTRQWALAGTLGVGLLLLLLLLVRRRIARPT